TYASASHHQLIVPVYGSTFHLVQLWKVHLVHVCSWIIILICHFYHHEFYRCKIMDKNLKTLALVYVGIKFVKLDVENAPFFVAKLAIKALPCVILFKKGIDVDRLVGFQDLRSKEDFPTRALEHILILKTK
ncbi:hypothetical protein ACJX0J_009631, partial [Zea mays]